MKGALLSSRASILGRPTNVSYQKKETKYIVEDALNFKRRAFNLGLKV